MEQNENFNLSLDYTINLANSAMDDMCEREEYKTQEIIRLEKESRFNRQVSLASLIVAVLALVVAIWSLAVTIF